MSIKKKHIIDVCKKVGKDHARYAIWQGHDLILGLFWAFCRFIADLLRAPKLVTIMSTPIMMTEKYLKYVMPFVTVLHNGSPDQ